MDHEKKPQLRVVEPEAPEPPPIRERDDLVFPMAEFRSRLKSLREAIAVRGVDAILITNPENLFYLTGYQTPGYYYFQCLVVPLESDPFMVVRNLEASNVDTRTWIGLNRPYADTASPMGVVASALHEFHLQRARIGIEKSSYFFRATEQEELEASMPDAHFFDCSGTVEQLRLVKSPLEIEYIRRAVTAAEAGMQAGIAAIRPSATENDVAAEIHRAMILAGSEYPAIAPFVASGWRCSVGHSTWEGRVIESNDVLFLEVGGCVHRYHGAIMRTVVVGEPPPVVMEAEHLINEAVSAVLPDMRPGVAAGDIDATCRSILARHSRGGSQGTRSGYSIGIGFAPDWGEGHILSIQPSEPRYLEENMTFHLIPWLQVPGEVGVGISETVLVTEAGAERLTTLPRKVFVR